MDRALADPRRVGPMMDRADGDPRRLRRMMDRVHPEERCARCGKEAPTVILGPGGQVSRGWVTHVEDTLIVEVGYGDEPVFLPLDVTEAIRAFDGHLIQVEADPDVQVPAIRSESTYLGIVCAECQRDTGWDDFQWGLFLAGLMEDETT
jgi:hypothetical protein